MPNVTIPRVYGLVTDAFRFSSLACGKSRDTISLYLSLSFFFSARDFETVHRACNCIPRYITRLEEIMLLVFYIDRGERNSNKISRTS